MDDASPAPPPPGSPAAMERKLSPGVLLLIAILAMVFFIFGLLHLLAHNLLRLRRARRRRRRVVDAAAAADGSSPTAFQGQLQQLFHLHDAGVDQAFIDALPVFPYRAVAAAAGGEDAEPFDCAVCLCEFAADDKLRLLPTCGHAFHVPCIDAWLLAHSTCPLCRGSILAADADYSYYSYSSPLPPSASSLLLLPHHHHSHGPAETGARDSSGDCDPGARDGGDESPSASPRDAAVEEVVEVKLGKLRSIDGGNASARDLAPDCTGSSNGGGRGSLGQRRCLSMGSYEYVMADHAALRVTIKATTPKRRPAGSRSSRRRHALSACDLGCPPKKAGAWEAAVTEAAAAASEGRCGDGAASLSRDSFSTSKIWMASGARREEDGRRTGPAAEPSGVRRAASFRWPAMASGCKRHRRDEGPSDVEAGGDNAVSSPEEERPPSVARTAMLWVAGGRQGSHS